VENKFSVLKRKFSGDIKARRFRIQMKEIANKMIVCNLHRFLLYLSVEVFYRAKNLKNPGNLEAGHVFSGLNRAVRCFY